MGRDATPSAPGLVELLHADAQRVIVRISAGQGLALQSALGEGSTAEIAEDRARQRLSQVAARGEHSLALGLGQQQAQQLRLQ